MIHIHFALFDQEVDDPEITAFILHTDHTKQAIAMFITITG